jgi:hypothetical protein
MRKFLIIALSLASLGALTNIACADTKELKHKYSDEELKKTCDKTGGTFVREGGGSYRCDYKGGDFVECNKQQKCIYVKPFTLDRSKVSGRTLNGNLGSTTKLGGTSTGTRGGTATGANMGGGVMFGSTMNGGTTPAGTKGGAGSVTAVTSNPTLNPTGGAFGVSRIGLGAGPIAGGINNNGRKPQ